MKAAIPRARRVGKIGRAQAVFALSLCTAACPLFGAPTDEALHFERFSSRDGLPAAVVYCAIEDSRGFLWFGTADGVARFDGRGFRVFRPDPADASSLGNAAVLGLAEDAAGDVWMATEGGLDVWRRQTEQFEHFRDNAAVSNGLGDDTTQSLALNPNGSLCVGTRRAGVSEYDPRTGRFTRLSAVNRGWARCLLRDRRGALWIGTGTDGLISIEGGTQRVRVYRHDPAVAASLIDDRIACLAEDAAGELWIGTERGLCRLDVARESFTRHPLQLDGRVTDPSVTALIADRDGVLGVGTDGQGFVLYEPATGRTVQHRRSRYAGNSLAADAVRAVFRDSRGDLWIGHFPSGISHFDRSAAAFQVFTSVPGATNTLSDDQVLCFWEEPDGDLWVGTDNGGANRWHAATGQWSREDGPRPAASESIKSALSILRDRQGSLWIASWDGGVSRHDERTGEFTRYLPEPSQPAALASLHAWRLAEDPQGNVWIATIGGGLERFAPQRGGFEHHRHDPGNPESLNDDIVSSLLVARDGALWAGTPKGVARRDPATGRWQRFLDRPGQPGALTGFWVFDLLEDRTGQIWASSEGGGLSRLDPHSGAAVNFRTGHGLPGNVLHGLLEDEAGALWIGTNRGLVRFDPPTGRIRVFDESNGLPGAQFNPHARLRLRNGDFLFGTTQGFVRFAPAALLRDSPPPRVVLTEFTIANVVVQPGVPGSLLARSITETRRLEVPANAGVLGFEFAGMDFRSPARLRYQVRLDGFDSAWRDLGHERRAIFTRLDAGEYRLRIRASNGATGWSSGDTGLELIVVPPWWRTSWFRGGLGLGVIALASGAGWAFSAHRLRESQRQRELQTERERSEERARSAEALRRLNEDLERRVADRTSQLAAAVRELEAFSYSVSHDLRAPLRSIHGFSRVLLEDYTARLDADGRDSLQRICAASERMGQLIDDLINLARVSRDTMHCTTVDLTAMANEVAVDLRQESPRREIVFEVAAGLTAHGDARLLRIVLENLLGNACKFSSKRATARVEFGRTMRGGTDTFYVRDNGAGFDMRFAQKMFGAFQRFHSSAEFPGTGIGLATVQRIIHRHGGDVAAEGRPDEGATFYFTLPPTNP
jgi:signal transduction histidine kinase/ligand-binding sensor domain-containing protein